MALSTRQREMIKEEDRIIESLINPSYKEQTVINEGSGGLYDLEEIENLLGSTTFNYNKPKEFVNSYSKNSTIDISLLLFSNSNVKIPKSKNLLSYSFDFSDAEDDKVVWAHKERIKNSCEIEEFWCLPPDDSFIEGNTEDSVNNFVKKCDCDTIYQVYSKEAVEGMRSKFPTAYSLFVSGNIVTVRSKDPSSTLSVRYDRFLGKFIYEYNPVMIFTTAIDEYTSRKYCYPSLTACYIYLLTFLISHEMLHIVVNNTVSYSNTNETNLGNHTMANVLMDGFINSEVAKRLRGFAGTGFARDKESPIPEHGVGTIISMRAQHNVGLKNFYSEKELVEEIYKVLEKRLEEKCRLYIDFNEDDDFIRGIGGGDFVLNVRVPSGLGRFRKNSGNFQNLISSIFKVLSDGTAIFSNKLSEIEKSTDYDVVPNGTLVRLRNTTQVCYVISYNDSDKYAGDYELNYADRDGIEREALSDGSILCRYKYKDSGRLAGYYKRNGFLILNGNENSYIEGGNVDNGPTSLSKEDLDLLKNRPKNLIDYSVSKYGFSIVREKLAKALETLQIKSENESVEYAEELIGKCKGVENDDCYSILTKDVYNRFNRYMKEYISNKIEEERKKFQQSIPQQTQPQKQMPQQKPQQTPQPPTGGGINSKRLSVGTYVFVKTIGEFGVVTAVNSDGTFRISKVKQEKPVIIDDSDNYK